MINRIGNAVPPNQQLTYQSGNAASEDDNKKQLKTDSKDQATAIGGDSVQGASNSTAVSEAGQNGSEQQSNGQSGVGSKSASAQSPEQLKKQIKTLEAEARSKRSQAGQTTDEEQAKTLVSEAEKLEKQAKALKSKLGVNVIV